MQNNVIDLTQRLLRALDSNYNVIDMPTVFSVVSLLEQVAVTKELLEATRLGKHVNELRRKTDNDQLSRRAKLLVKKWRSIVLPTEPPASGVNNGQLKATTPAAVQQSTDDSGGDTTGGATPTHQRKRPAKSSPETTSGAAPAPPSKRLKANGQQPQQSSSSELFELSDNSNSSFKDVITAKMASTAASVAAAAAGHQALSKQQHVIMINSDSNESNPCSVQPVQQQQTQQQPQVEEQQPKKRGRKKGSKNHKNLLDEAESSFTNKLAVSRGNSKVKTTQELIAGLQNRNSQAAAAALGSTTPNSSSMTPGKSNSKGEDLNLRAAKLTERVSIIDKKLNTNANRYKNSAQRRKLAGSEKSPKRVIESGSVINDKSLLNHRRVAHRYSRVFEDDSEEVIVVDDVSSPRPSQEGDDENSLGSTSVGAGTESGTHPETDKETDDKSRTPEVRSLSYEEAMALLPPVNKDWLLEEEARTQEPACTCVVKENKDFSVEDNDEDLQQRFELIEDPQCPAGSHFAALRATNKVTPEQLHRCQIEGVNGNRSLGPPPPPPVIDPVAGLYANVVPNVNNELVPKDVVDTVNNNKSCLAEQKEPTSPCSCCVKCKSRSSINNSSSRGASPTFASENYKKYSISEEQRTECDRCGCHQLDVKKVGVIGGNNDSVESGILNSEITEAEEKQELEETTSPPPPQQEKSDNSCENGGDGAELMAKAAPPPLESFREWHEVLEWPSFNDEPFRILPYVIID